MDVSILSLRFNRNCFNIKLNTLSTGALDAGTLKTLNAIVKNSFAGFQTSKQSISSKSSWPLIFNQVVTCDDKVLGFTEDRVK